MDMSWVESRAIDEALAYMNHWQDIGITRW